MLSIFNIQYYIIYVMSELTDDCTVITHTMWDRIISTIQRFILANTHQYFIYRQKIRTEERKFL